MNDFNRQLAVVAKFVETMNETTAIGEISQLLDRETKLPPEVLAQMIMNELPCPDETLPTAAKQYWLVVAGHMGPDWVAELRNVGDFMDKVTSF